MRLLALAARFHSPAVRDSLTAGYGTAAVAGSPAMTCTSIAPRVELRNPSVRLANASDTRCGCSGDSPGVTPTQSHLPKAVSSGGNEKPSVALPMRQKRPGKLLISTVP